MVEPAADAVRFYFSLRSPYSWLAMLRIEQALADLAVTLQYLPVFPPPDFKNDPAAVPDKLKYIQHDVARIAGAYGLRTAQEIPLDTSWVRPHAAFVYAQDEGRGRAFALALYSARFEDGRDIGDDAVMAAAAESLGLDAAALVAAADDKAFQTRVVQGMIQGATEDSIFGVPYFVFRGERFFGNDRIDWLVRAIRLARGESVPDLRVDLLASVS